MQIPERLCTVADRAKALNLTLSLLMKRVGMSVPQQASVYRWANGAVDPQLSHYERVMAELEAQLKIEEARLREALRLPEAAE